MDNKTMTVKELKDQLSAYPDDMPVITEGCDCYGDVGSLQQLKNYDGLGGDCVLVSRGFPAPHAHEHQEEEENLPEGVV